jgi:hypothetical protein
MVEESHNFSELEYFTITLEMFLNFKQKKKIEREFKSSIVSVSGIARRSELPLSTG